MNSAVVAAFAAVLAVANAGFLAAPAVYTSQLSSQAGLGVSHSSGIVRGAPLIAAHPATTLVRVARGAVYSAGVVGAPLAYAAAPALYSSPALISRSYHGVSSPVVYGGVPHIRVARGILTGAAPIAYSAGPVAYAQPIAYAAPAVKTVAYSAGPIAYAAHPAFYGAPLTYAAGPVAYAAPVKAVHAAPVFL